MVLVGMAVAVQAEDFVEITKAWFFGLTALHNRICYGLWRGVVAAGDQ